MDSLAVNQNPVKLVLRFVGGAQIAHIWAIGGLKKTKEGKIKYEQYFIQNLKILIFSELFKNAFDSLKYLDVV